MLVLSGKPRPFKGEYFEIDRWTRNKWKCTLQSLNGGHPSDRWMFSRAFCS